MLLDANEFLVKTDVMGKSYRGIVVDNVDAKHLGRVKCKIEGLFEGSTESLPWVYPRNPAGLGGRGDLSSFAVPDIDSELEIVFPTKEPYFGFYIGYWQSAMTHQGIFNEDYPWTYGFRDSQGTWVRIDRAKKYAEFQHTSGSRIKFSPDGDIELKSRKSVTLISEDERTKFKFDMETGDVDLGPKGNLAIGGKQTTFNPKQLNFNPREVKENIAGSRESTIAGGCKKTIGGSYSRAILTNEATTVGQNKSELVGLDYEHVAGTSHKDTVALGDRETELLLGDRKVTILAGNYKVDVTAGNITIETLAGEVSLGNALASLEIDVAGGIKLKNNLGGMTVNPAGMVALGGATAEVLDLFGQTLTGIQSIIVGTGVGPSSPPLNAAVFAAIQALLLTIKGSL